VLILVENLFTLALYGVVIWGFVRRKAIWRRITRPRRLRREERRAREHALQRADEEKARFALPVGERIQVHALWLVEAYPPSHIESLLRGLDRLGLEEAQIPGSPTYRDSLRAARGSAYGGSSYELPC
jgi:hypothetical protein